MRFWGAEEGKAMSMVVRAFPVLKGKLPRLKELAQRK